jgi:hydroxyethylthiazole kinase-like uncharacterized protein yjeF
MRVLTSEEARAFDRWAIEELGVPSMVLMENAALAIVDTIGGHFPDARRVAILCGPGNNGGDGFAVGRQLATRGYDVRLLLAAFGRPLSNDCSRQLEICQAMELEIHEAGADWPAAAAALAGAELVVDALFGTGLARPLASPYDLLVEWISTQPAPVVAVDVPSGLDASSAHPIGPAVRADLTVTFAAPRVAHVLFPSAAWCGELAVADLGVSFDLSPQADGDLYLRSAEELAAVLVPREKDAHKGDFGRLLLVAGSRGMGGAAILAARAAMVGGAGLVRVATIDENRAPLLAVVPEAMTIALPATASGGLAAGAWELLEAAIEESDVVALGPGCGADPESRELARRLALAVDRPLLLDADGLNAFAGRAAELRQRSAPTVITPHPGELGRLFGRDTASIQNDRLAAVREAVELTGATVVLKGHRTLVGRPGGEVSIHPVGNPAMASAGAGDVLTGLLAARLAQGDEPAIAAELAVHLHGTAGDLAVADGRGPAVPAGTLIEFLPRAFAALEKLAGGGTDG